MSYTVAVVGASGLVGREIITTLEQRAFAIKRLLLLGSERSAGKTMTFRGQSIVIERATDDSFDGVDIALFSAGANVSRALAPKAAQAGAVVIDNSSAWREHPEVPLVVPEVNIEQARNRPLGIIANPNCSTIQLVVALKPLHDAAQLQHVIVSTYQSVSGKGKRAIDELWENTRDLAEGKTPSASVFPAPIAMNLISDWAAGIDDFCEEERKMINETRKIMGDNAIRVSPTTVRVPVAVGHAESVFVQLARPLSLDQARKALRDAPGIELVDAPYAPGQPTQPIQVVGTDAVYVGRLRQDPTMPNTLMMWVVADNLRKGAALNAVQIAESL